MGSVDQVDNFFHLGFQDRVKWARLNQGAYSNFWNMG